ncbi:peptidoglycan-binding domain-containing protein [Fusibacter bizertensis]|uniref:Peptidoglycan-binding domain-containing protein n=1 Tax=Fusibacter bizertensis TaxID=1488331 RepID=A0ABT6NCT3_9FIRM|nr:peptidoglycan-binding domain-containing protein [Fusibacter bizertensis]MDH8678191.1 peptidoglycan-binding domain-containing protein [Fusibacter bizertensis]
MGRKIKALVLVAVMIVTMFAMPGTAFADTDTWTSATPTTPTEPAPTTPTTPTTPTAPTEPTTEKPEVMESDFAIPTITRVLYFGTSGVDVESLQNYLIKLGYSIEADGMFGNMTLKTVKAFQTKAGLVVDGYVGKNTNKAIYDAAGGTDAITTASLVNDIDAFKAGISENGTWIITTLGDLVSEEELVLEGTFKNGKQDKVTGEDLIQRKIGLYTQDEDHNVTARFTLTAPKLTINSPNTRLQSGTFYGNIYVNATGFNMKDFVVEGNVYYTTQEVKDTASIDDTDNVKGEIALVEIIEGTDVVTSASLTYETDVFANSIGAEGTWIISVLKDMTIDQDLVLTGEFLNGRGTVQRKIALYSQDDAHVVTRKFTLTAPKLTIESPNARIQGGIFKGDVYVTVDNFQLVKATVDGNIYFTTQSAKDTFTMDEESSVTGEKILTEVDAVVSPSLYRDEDALIKNLSKDGTWIIYAGNDVTTDQPLYLMGDFTYKDVVQRKIALYSQDDTRKVTRRFTLTAPMLVINSTNARLEKGDFVGDIYVQKPNFKLNVAKVTGNIYVGPFATGFTMVDTAVTGNVYYATQSVMDSAVIDELTTVSGVQEVE